MGKLILKILSLTEIILFFVSWHIKIIFAWILFLVSRRRIPCYDENKKIINRGVLVLFFVSFWFFFPNRTSNSDDYIQSVYFDTNTRNKMDAVKFQRYLVGSLPNRVEKENSTPLASHKTIREPLDSLSSDYTVNNP
jgi:hypothetical protein